MLAYLLKRLALAALTLFVILFASYGLTRLAPGDPTKSSMLGDGGPATSGLSAEKGALAKNASMREKLHLDKPILVGFGLWLEGIALHADFGSSVSVDKGRPVLDIIAERLPVTLKLNILSIALIYAFALPLGIWTALRPDSVFDKSSAFALFLLYSLPSIWVALLLQVCLCKGGWLPIFPLKGLQPDIQQGASTWEMLRLTAMQYALPVACLSYAGFAGIARFARAGMLEVTRQDYIRTARAKGLPESAVILKHAFRNALVIMITLFAGILPGLVAGSILVEYVFGIPGMGSLSMLALSSRDIPLMMSLFAFGGAMTLAGILLSDILYVLADPRISFESRI
jgi:peptide/nickel transport system permease protein